MIQVAGFVGVTPYSTDVSVRAATHAATRPRRIPAPTGARPSVMACRTMSVAGAPRVMRTPKGKNRRLLPRPFASWISGCTTPFYQPVLRLSKQASRLGQRPLPRFPGHGEIKGGCPFTSRWPPGATGSPWRPSCRSRRDASRWSGRSSRARGGGGPSARSAGTWEGRGCPRGPPRAATWPRFEFFASASIREL